MNHPQAIRSLLRLIIIGSSIVALHTTTLHAQLIGGTRVPQSLEVPAGHEAFLKAGAIGTQNYICLPSGWTFIGPQATLFVTLPWINGTIRQQIATHFLSHNPAEDGTARPTWQSSIDTSVVWAKPIATSTDSAGPGAIPWLLLQAAGGQKGPTGGASFSQTTYIQRVNTSGGIMPTGACTVGERAFVSYAADYMFNWRARQPACEEFPWLILSSARLALAPFDFALDDWAVCNGQPISDNAALFSLIGATFGGDGHVTFALPDLRGRVPISVGQGPGFENYSLGQTGVSEHVAPSRESVCHHISWPTPAVIHLRKRQLPQYITAKSKFNESDDGDRRGWESH